MCAMYKRRRRWRRRVAKAAKLRLSEWTISKRKALQFWAMASSQNKREKEKVWKWKIVKSVNGKYLNIDTRTRRTAAADRGGYFSMWMNVEWATIQVCKAHKQTTKDCLCSAWGLPKVPKGRERKEKATRQQPVLSLSARLSVDFRFRFHFLVALCTFLCRMLSCKGSKYTNTIYI